MEIDRRDFLILGTSFLAACGEGRNKPLEDICVRTPLSDKNSLKKYILRKLSYPKTGEEAQIILVNAEPTLADTLSAPFSKTVEFPLTVGDEMNFARRPLTLEGFDEKELYLTVNHSPVLTLPLGTPQKMNEEGLELTYMGIQNARPYLSITGTVKPLLTDHGPLLSGKPNVILGTLDENPYLPQVAMKDYPCTFNQGIITSNKNNLFVLGKTPADLARLVDVLSQYETNARLLEASTLTLKDGQLVKSE